jgi:hypothetical protein
VSVAGHDPASPRHDPGRSPLDVGTRVRTGEPLPRPGSWEVVDHDCPQATGTGQLAALGPPDMAPSCFGCGEPVTWQLTHLASSVAADHRRAGPLP